MEFFHVDPTKPNVIQSKRTLQRTRTLAEASQVKFATLTDPMRAFLVNLTAQRKYVAFGPPSAATPNIVFWGTAAVDAWTVPVGAVAPTSLTVFGSAATVNGVAGAPFDDNVTVASAARTAAIKCTQATNADVHCDSSTGVTQYAQNSYFNYVQLYARSAQLVSFFDGTALYIP